MKLKLDENLAHSHRERLRAAGHDVDTVVSEGLGGASDDQVMAAAIDAGRALVTLDLDFADPWRFPPAESSGIAVLRVRGRPGRRDIEPLVDRLIATLEEADITGCLWVVDPHRVRQFQAIDRDEDERG